MSRQKPHVTSAQIKNYLAVRGLWSPSIEKSYNLAVQIHKHAKRDDGCSYLEQHIFPIVQDVVAYYEDQKDTLPFVVQLAFIHDVLEDQETFPSKEILKLFGVSILRAAEFLKKPRVYIKGKYRTQKVKHYEHQLFVEQLKTAPKEIKILKCLDRVNNLICTDPKRRPKQYERFLADTEDYYIPFAKEIDRNLYLVMLKEAERIKDALQFTYNINKG